jgi:hypothetical protein
MTKCLTSFPSSAMVVPDEDHSAVSDASHATEGEAKAHPASGRPAVESTRVFRLSPMRTGR